ncbi:hypothetical protein BAE44_0023507, partial [Dichanthelium oligosanthes]
LWLLLYKSGLARCLGIHGHAAPSPITGMNMMDWWLSLRVGLNKFQQKGCDSAFMLISWMLWKERNGRVFNNRQDSSAPQLVRAIIEEGQAWIEAGAKHLTGFGWPSAQVASLLVVCLTVNNNLVPKNSCVCAR